MSGHSLIRVHSGIAAHVLCIRRDGGRRTHSAANQAPSTKRQSTKATLFYLGVYYIFMFPRGFLQTIT